MVSRLATAAWLFVSIPVPGAALPPAGPATDYEVKAAFLYNFAKFVEWPEPASPGAPLVVTVLGDDPFGPVLDRTLAGRTAQERTLVARRISRAEDAEPSQILFVGASEEPRLPQILSVLEGRSVLTVSEMDGFAERGGMIGFRTEGSRVRFDINLQQATRARLRISAELLQMARIVGRRGAR